MKKVLFACCSIALVQLCTAQTTKKSAIKFTPPVIEKDNPTVQRIAFTPPVIKKNKSAETNRVKFTLPVTRKDQPIIKKVKFAPPRIVKDPAQ